MEYLIEDGIPEENMFWINFELSEYFEIDNIDKLEKLITNKSKD